LLTSATRVRIEVLLAFRKILSAKDIICFVRRFDRSPSLVVLQKSYGFVEACVAFRSMLTRDSLRFAYAAAGREFVERMSSLFIVLTDGVSPCLLLLLLPFLLSKTSLRLHSWVLMLMLWRLLLLLGPISCCSAWRLTALVRGLLMLPRLPRLPLKGLLYSFVSI
jgi:hypothetical protein